MIRRDLHPICDNCWWAVAAPALRASGVSSVESYKARNRHHYFTFNKNPQCCWCGSPSHGQFWKAPKKDVPCQGLWGFHNEQHKNTVDIAELERKYRGNDAEVIELISMCKALQAELTEVEKRESSAAMP